MISRSSNDRAYARRKLRRALIGNGCVSDWGVHPSPDKEIRKRQTLCRALWDEVRSCCGKARHRDRLGAFTSCGTRSVQAPLRRGPDLETQASAIQSMTP